LGVLEKKSKIHVNEKLANDGWMTNGSKRNWD